MKHIFSEHSSSAAAAGMGHGRDAKNPGLLNQSVAGWFESVRSCKPANGEVHLPYTLREFKKYQGVWDALPLAMTYDFPVLQFYTHVHRSGATPLEQYVAALWDA